jgi:predicted phosphate transport protein (TIGR00153 family)
MGFQVIPRERVFFDLLEEAAANVVLGARELCLLVDALPDGSDQRERIREIERYGDVLTHRIMETLNTTFVPPFDRQDIHRLASSLDDVLDLVEAVSDMLILHRVGSPLQGVRQQAATLARITEVVEEVVRHLRTLSGSDRARADINRLEREGDHIYRRTVAELFSGSYAAIDVLKWKDVVDQLEEAVDRCRQLSNAAAAIELKFG